VVFPSTLSLPVQGTAAELRARDCTFCGNGASGLWTLAGGRAMLADCALLDNGCNGTACWDAGSRLAARRTRAVGNALHGVRLLHGSAGALAGCALEGNAQHGLEVGCGARVDLTSCTLAGAPWPVHHYQRAAESVCNLLYPSNWLPLSVMDMAACKVSASR
jgi:hypothetical protein